MKIKHLKSFRRTGPRQERCDLVILFAGGKHDPVLLREGVRSVGRRVILQVVGKRGDIAVGDEWNGREPRTRIIVIGAHEWSGWSFAARSF